MLAGPGTGTGPIAEAFRAGGTRAKLMPYLMGGFPDLASSLAVGQAYAEAGAQLVEVGIPFSDPLADGPAVQAAGEVALHAGANLDNVLEQVVAPLSATLPVAAMCYLNPMLRRGFDRAVGQLKANGASGLIVPDLPAREATEVRAACDRAKLDLIPLVAPTTPPDEIDWIAGQARGFVYVVAVTGVTGERNELQSELSDVVARVKAAASVPVAVGFGVGTPEQAARVAEMAEGVIVGSRLVRAMAEAPSTDAGLSDVRRIVASMVAALGG